MAPAQRHRFITDSEASLIHEKSLYILTNKGVKVEYAKALKLLQEAGAEVDHNTQMVKFPLRLIEKAMQAAPKEFTIKAASPEHDLPLPHPKGSYYTCTCVQSMKYHDPISGKFVDVTRDSFAEWCQLGEALPNVHKIAIQTPMDVPHEIADLHALNIQLQNTSKALMVLSYCPETVDYLFELMLAKAGGRKALAKRPQVQMYPTSLSPLKFKPMDMEGILKCCEYGVSIVANSLAISGATAPVTPAGTALLACAEILAMLVMAQLFKPGTEVIGSTYTTSMDMATGAALLNSAEAMLGRAAASRVMKQEWGIPTETFSFMTDSYLSDGQAALEKSLMPALLQRADSDIQYGMGRLGGATYASPVQLVIDDEIHTIIERCNAPIEVNEDTLALEEILENAPEKQFVTSMHTLKHCRENIRPSLFVSKGIDAWQSEGGKDLYERARDKYQAISRTLAPQDISDDVKAEMDRIVQHAHEHLVGKLK